MSTSEDKFVKYVESLNLRVFGTTTSFNLEQDIYDLKTYAPQLSNVLAYIERRMLAAPQILHEFEYVKVRINVFVCRVLDFELDLSNSQTDKQTIEDFEHDMSYFVYMLSLLINKCNAQIHEQIKTNKVQFPSTHT